MNHFPVNPVGNVWSIEVTGDQIAEWLRPAIKAQTMPTLVHLALEFLLRQWAGKRIRLSAETIL